jgi:hypothetical protein
MKNNLKEGLQHHHVGEVIKEEIEISVNKINKYMINLIFKVYNFIYF